MTNSNISKKTIRGIFYYMDRSYLLEQSKTTLNDVCIELFRETIFNDESLKRRIVDGACDLVAADRQRDSTDMAMLSSSIGMFHDLATYTSSYEPRLLAISQTYIADWAEENSSKRTLASYVDPVQSKPCIPVCSCDLAVRCRSVDGSTISHSRSECQQLAKKL